MKRSIVSRLAQYCAKRSLKDLEIARWYFDNYPPDSAGYAKGELWMQYADIWSGIAEAIDG